MHCGLSEQLFTYKAAVFTCREKSQAAKESLISKSKRLVGTNKERISISVYSDIEKGRNSDTDDSFREIDDDAATWNQLLRSTSDEHGSPNNLV